MASRTETNANESGYYVEITGTEVVKDADGNGVTAQFKVNKNRGLLVINKRYVSLTSASGSKEYDGSPLTKNELTDILVGGDGFAENDGATYNITGSQTLVGSSPNKFTYKLNEGTLLSNYTIEPFEGMLTVTNREAKYEITVEAKSKEDKYTGENHTVSGLKETTFDVAGHKYTVSGLNASASGTDAGAYPSNITGTAVVKDKDGNDVTSQFAVKTTAGKLVIKQREVLLTSASDTKMYDGKPLTRNAQTDITVTGDGFVKDDGATYNITGSQTIVGTSANEFTYTLSEGTKSSNYKIDKKEGNLTVTNRDAKYEITVKANSNVFKYDGSPKTVEGLETTNFIVEGNAFTVEGLTASETQTNANESGYTVNVIGTAIVKDADGNDVTDQFAVTPENGKLVINKRKVTLTSATDEKEYDGKPLTRNAQTDVLVSEDGFAGDEGATYLITGSQTLVGNSENIFTYVLNAGTKKENYEITPAYGTLTVKNRDAKYEITVEALSLNETYNGKPKAVDGLKESTVSVNGQKFKVSGLTAKGEGTNAGSYPVNVIGTAAVLDEDGNDVTSQFSVKTKNGIINIEKAKLTVETQSAEKEYDGRPLTAKGKITGLVNDETVTFTVTGSQTSVNEGTPHENNNTYSLLFDGTAKADNYEITEKIGTLTVKNRTNKYVVSAQTDDVTITYDGLSHGNFDFRLEAKNNNLLMNMVQPVTDFFNNLFSLVVNGMDKTSEISIVADGMTYKVTGVKVATEATDAGKYAMKMDFDEAKE